jgi:hypothetical protein
VSRISPSQASECRKQISDGLPFMDRSCQTVPVYVIKAQELLCAHESPVRCPEPGRLSLAGPMLSVKRPDLQGPPFVVADDCASGWWPMIKFENAVFFSRTPDPETLSRSLFFEARALRASKAGGSTHY